MSSDLSCGIRLTFFLKALTMQLVGKVFELAYFLFGKVVFLSLLSHSVYFYAAVQRGSLNNPKNISSLTS